jgi:hypothetical protein
MVTVVPSHSLVNIVVDRGFVTKAIHEYGWYMIGRREHWLAKEG